MKQQNSQKTLATRLHRAPTDISGMKESASNNQANAQYNNGESDLPTRVIGIFCKILTSCQQNLTVVFITMPMNNLSFGDK